MKRIFLALVFVFGSAAFVTSMAAPQVIETDCGTKHQIADNSTPQQAADAVEQYSDEDCMGTITKEQFMDMLED